MKKVFGLSLVLSMSLAAHTALAQKSRYYVVNTFHISGGDRWDYVALHKERLYVSHTNKVNILDKNTGDSVGVIDNTKGVHGIAFDASLNKGFTSNGKANTVTVFDISSNKSLAEIKVGDNPDAIMYDQFSKKVYVCNGHSKDLSVIDPAHNEVVKTIALGGKPETAVSDGAGMLYVNIEDKNEVVVVDTKTYAVLHHWKTGKGEEPSGLAMDTKSRRLFSGCGNQLLVVLDADNGKVVKELPIGDGCDGTAFDAAKKLVFAANGDGTLTVIKEQSANDFSVVENVLTKKGARTLVVDEGTHKVYLPTAELTPPAEGQKRPGIISGTFQVLVVGQ